MHLHGAPPCLLALETSTQTSYLGVMDAQGTTRVRTLPGGAASSATLITAIFALLDESSLSLRQLDALAFGRGPGAFTGVRTACALAQGLSLGARLPLLAIDSLMAVAEDAGADMPPGQVCAVAVDARMGELYCAVYERDSGLGRWRTLAPAQLVQPSELASRWAETGIEIHRWAGNGLQLASQAFGALAGPLAESRPLAAASAAALLRLALASWQDGERLTAAQALPLYVRDKVAQTTAEREAHRAANPGAPAS